MVAAIVEERREELAEICRRRRVRKLEIFGSAADGTFDPSRSDLDFLVEYEPLQEGEHYEAYFGLWEDLAALFGRKVDLVVASAMRNPYFIREVNASRKLVYGS